MPEVIKVATSAWPIVFAAVVAQVFKAYATWRVERGIKLMQLEQLIGSNSFGSAIKQPMVLRQLDILSLVLLLTWCLSPFGSSALQRTIHTGFATKIDPVDVWYLKQYGVNKVFGHWNADNLTSTTDHAAGNEMAAILFLSTLVPYDTTGTTHSPEYMDSYNMPYLKKPRVDGLADSRGNNIAGMGLPIALPYNPPVWQLDTTKVDPTSVYELISFDVDHSYFEFTCTNFSTVTYDALEPMAWSGAHTLGMIFSDPGNTSSITRLHFASANLDATQEILTNYTTWDYSVTQCDFVQRFVESPVTCKRWQERRQETGKDYDSDYMWEQATLCWADFARPNSIPPETAASKNMSTPLEGFADDWTAMAAPRNPNTPGVFPSPSELPCLFKCVHKYSANSFQRKYSFRGAFLSTGRTHGRSISRK